MGHQRLGFSSVGAYAKERIGRTGRWVDESRMLARRLLRMPATRAYAEMAAADAVEGAEQSVVQISVGRDGQAHDGAGNAEQPVGQISVGRDQQLAGAARPRRRVRAHLPPRSLQVRLSEHEARRGCRTLEARIAQVYKPRMDNRDVERNVNREQFVATLRRVADAIETGEGIRIQVAGKRFTVPAGAELSIEHEAQAGNEELELQLRWQT